MLQPLTLLVNNELFREGENMNQRDYGVDEAVHSHEIYDIINSFDYDIPFWREQAGKAKGPVLELCCGTGRITVPLAKHGIPIVGADLSRNMLAGFQKRCVRENIFPRSISADMRSFDLPERFSLIFVPFNSFQCLYSLADIEAALACIRRHLSPTGRFILDVFNPSIEIMVDRFRAEQENQTLNIPAKGVVRWKERCCYDAAAQVNRVTWTFIFPDGTEEIQRLDMRCFYPQELSVLLKANGFIVEHFYGGYDCSEFCSESPKQILVCRLG
ncbi:MAG: hypothetical protein ACD_76C00138G0002 [uncultured bacterium]|nr:MAG: hypothetical protein ACD_76C00138G0002 [uncultured bacterium]